MSEEQRKWLERVFREMYMNIESIQRELLAISGKYPGLQEEQLFLNLEDNLVNAKMYADGLSDYIRIAKDTDWSKKRDCF